MSISIDNVTLKTELRVGGGSDVVVIATIAGLEVELIREHVGMVESSIYHTIHETGILTAVKKALSSSEETVGEVDYNGIPNGDDACPITK